MPLVKSAACARLAVDDELGEEQARERFWLRLVSARGLGPAGARRLAAVMGGPRELLETPLSQLRELGLGAGILGALSTIESGVENAALDWRDAQSARHLLCIDNPAYPPQLAELPDAPLVLLLQGRPEVLAAPQIAIVGSRNPTATGVDTAHAFAQSLGRAGLAITSGLARGIDAAAHRGALSCAAKTVAVLGHGPDRVYPREHEELARAIVDEDGAVVGEFLPGVAPMRANFPRRNRLISGLSYGVLVVEAAIRSGSLSTARCALEQGREVFAIPGSIHNPMARGCHRLIREGAKLVETTQDVLEELPPRAAAGLPTNAPEGQVLRHASADDWQPDDDYVTVLDALGYDPVPVDVLVRRTGLTPQALSSMLLNLQMKGLVSPVSGGRYLRRQEG